MIIPLFPLESGLFPDGIISLKIFEVRYLKMVKKTIDNGDTFGVVMLKRGSETRKPGVDEVLMEVGTTAEIIESNTLQPSLILIRCLGKEKFKLSSPEKGKYGLWTGEIEKLQDKPLEQIPESLLFAANALGKIIFSMQKNGIPFDKMPIHPPFRLDDPGWVANRWTELLNLKVECKQSLLEETCPIARLEKVAGFLSISGKKFEC